MIKPHPKRLGWFSIDMETAQPLFGIPGVHFVDGQILAHRTHLPLLGIDAPVLPGRPSEPRASDRWQARDAFTATRGFKLRTTQQQAIDFITARSGALIGDEPRIGKTLSAIMSHDPSMGPLVIVAPLSTRAVWLGWLRRVFENPDIGLITGRKYDPEVLTKPFVFGHYDVIHKWQALFDIGTLVLDEAHLLTNRDAKRTLAAVLLRERSKRVIALTGTPIWKLPPGLWSIVGLVEPGAWGTYKEFAMRYGLPVETAWGTKYTGLSNEIELHARLNEIMLRRRWIDCHSDLPPITRSVVVAEVTQAQANKLDVLAGQLKSERSNTAGNLAAYRRQSTLTKLPLAIREAEKIIERGEPVVVWTWHKDFADRIDLALRNNGHAVYVIHGDVAPAERDRRMDLWREQPNAALVATMAVAQVGIDLSHARIAIVCELDYTPAVLGQAEMRTYAPTRPMDIIFVVANHLVDQRIVRALIAKLGAADPLGVGAAVDSIDALRDAIMGPQDTGDLDRLLEDLLAS